ncbi:MULTISPECIES: hypothetical protein [unclassified Streptomyces]|uniref:hypothetical protein n=1 Tax=unclassified Streptomyces TaxID=2593676 RepID=UPI00278C620F|nr:MULTISPECIES: hypothetical protein [unclassified Streptomyces]
MSLAIVGNLMLLVTSHDSVWPTAVSAVAVACQFAAVGISLRDFRRREQWDEVGE